MLQVINIAKSFNGTPALAGVSLTVDKGEILALLGPSGCGKTTLLRIIAGLEQPDHGQVLLNGQNLAHVPVHERRFGFVFQDYALFPHQSVQENIAFGLRMARVPARTISARVEEMLDLVNLQGYGPRSVHELSGGERQRVALARSLAPQPQLLLLDEPLASLDRALREELMGELHTILKRISLTAVYVTHDQHEAFALADRVAVMRQGQIAQVDEPQTVHSRPANLFVARFLGFSNLLPVTAVDDVGNAQTPLGSIPLPASTRVLQSPASVLLIRPDTVRLYPLPVATQQTIQPLPGVAGDEAFLLATTLRACSFRGSHYQIDVNAAGSDGLLHLTFHLPPYQTDPATQLLAPLVLPALGSSIHLILYPRLLSLLHIS
jgi:ABC-type Fe3+/spermidine/putrescine transport system ATPase subunit